MFVICAAVLISTGCKNLGKITEVGTSIAVATGRMEEERAEEITQQAEALVKSFEDITPEQEYYIGRAVGAVILEEFIPYDDADANGYLNMIGQTLSLVSERSETFGGYHFLILDTKEINAFAAPGGLIFVARGLLGLARNEDEVAAILAHEIAHVEKKHGLQAIKKNRITTALTDIAVSAAQHSRIEKVSELAAAFGDSVKDIFTTLVDVGYSRAFEKEADKSAAAMLINLGYDPRSLIRVLRRMSLRIILKREGFAKTHPKPSVRIGSIRTIIGNHKMEKKPPRERLIRYRKAMNRI